VPYSLNSLAVENTVFLTDETSVGASADGSNGGVAVGYSAVGTSDGTAVGAYSDAKNYGVAVGDTSTGIDWGTAVGYGTSAQLFGVALGANSQAKVGLTYGIAIGANAEATGDNSVAIGYETVNDISNTARLRGMLYLDGGNNVYTRDTFGTGAWTPLVSGFTGIVTNYDGSATQLLYYTNGLLKAVQ